jgi:hypothetical protein
VIYQLCANLVVTLHLIFIVFVALGGLLALRWRWLPWVHLPAAAWGGFVELTGRICPLTPLENRLRRAAGRSGYEGDFIEHHLLPVIYPAGLTREIQLILAALLLVLNIVIYAIVWSRRSVARREKQVPLEKPNVARRT